MCFEDFDSNLSPNNQQELTTMTMHAGNTTHTSETLSNFWRIFLHTSNISPKLSCFTLQATFTLVALLHLVQHPPHMVQLGLLLPRLRWPLACVVAFLAIP